MKTTKPAQIIAVLPTKNPNKVRLECRQDVQKEGQSALGLLNKSDERFTQDNSLITWVSAEKKDSVRLFPALKSVVDTIEDERVVLPKPLDFVIDGNDGNIQITENHIATAWQSENLEKSAKRKGKNGSFLLYGNMLIFRRTDLVMGTPNHTLIQYNSESDKPIGNYFIKAKDGSFIEMNNSEVLEQELASNVEDFE